MESNTVKNVDSILGDWSANEIKEKFDFLFQQFLEMSDGMEGHDLAEMFELINRVSIVFKSRETEIKATKNTNS